MGFFTRWRGGSPALQDLLPDPSGMASDLPFPAPSVADYDAAAARAAAALMDAGATLAGRFGRTGTPGVSDIDVYAVCPDARYAEVTARASAVRVLPENAAFFTHQIFVLPASAAPLRRVLFFDQTLNPFETLAGDEMLFRECTAPTPRSPALSALLWGGTLWRILARMHADRPGLRGTLLLVQAACRQASLCALSMGDSDGARYSALAQGLRQRVLALAPGARPVAAVDALREAADLWSAQEWRMQKRWQGALGNPEPKTELPEDLRTIRFGHEPGEPWSIPDIHLRLLGRIRERKADAGDPAWRDALRLYRDCRRRAEAVGEAVAGDRYALFLRGGTGVFPTPFNLIDR